MTCMSTKLRYMNRQESQQVVGSQWRKPCFLNKYKNLDFVLDMKPKNKLIFGKTRGVVNAKFKKKIRPKIPFHQLINLINFGNLCFLTKDSNF